jgi:hypothetical protein
MNAFGKQKSKLLIHKDDSAHFKIFLTRVSFRIGSVDRVVGHALDEEVEDGDRIFLSEICQNVKRISALRVRGLGVDLRFG